MKPPHPNPTVAPAKKNKRKGKNKKRRDGREEKKKVSALGLKEGTLPSLLSFSKTVGVPFRLRGLEMAVEDLGCVLILESCPFLGCPGTSTAED